MTVFKETTASPTTLPRVRLVVSEQMILLAVMVLALAQGLLYLFLVPPWQHYDEPTHFEYAWLIAQTNSLPSLGDGDQAMRREVAASMLAHDFYWNLNRPDLLSDTGEIWIGYSQLNDPPVYYLLVSLPLRFVQHLDVTSQLYVARSVSLVLFLATIALTIAIMRELTSPGHVLRWAVPMSIALLPAFVDIMTAVNNDVGAVGVFTLFLWGAVRALRFGVSLWNGIWICSTAVLAVMTKNTAAVALLLTPPTLLVGLWVRCNWPRRWLGLSLFLIIGGMTVALFGWGDAAYWYRWQHTIAQDLPTQRTMETAPFGTSAVTLVATPDTRGPILVNPVLPADVDQIAGETITIGGWLWADRAATVESPGIMVSTATQRNLRSITQPVSVTTTPRFVAWTFDVPADTRQLHYVFLAHSDPEATDPLQVFLDGAVLVPGDFPTDVAPSFDGPTGRSGTWGGIAFTNLVRDASAEQAWPRVRPWFNQLVLHYTNRSPTHLVVTLYDLERTSSLLAAYVRLSPFDTFFTSFAWGHVRLAHPVWVYAYRLIALATLVGGGLWLARRSRMLSLSHVSLLVLFVFAAMLVWGNTFLRPFPLLDGLFVFPVARYAFPAILPTMLMLIGGWWALWPRRWRHYGIASILVGLVALNGAAIYTIQSFYQALAAG